MRKLCFIVCLIAARLLPAQELDPEIYQNDAPKIRRNTIYGELLGSGFLFSLSYEHEMFRDQNFRLNARLGVGTAIFVNAVPLIGINGLLGKRENFFEVGMNTIRTYAFGIMGGESTFLLANPVLGYRYVGEKGLVFRASFTPFFSLFDPEDWVSDDFFLPFGGISVGYSF